MLVHVGTFKMFKNDQVCQVLQQSYNGKQQQQQKPLYEKSITTISC